MKRFYFIMVLALVTASCSQKIDSVFSQSATERLSAFQQECLDLLLSSENGWLIQYYPSSTRDYGGFTFAAVFDEDGNVSVTADFASDPTVTVTSHYSINTSNSVTLTFDTYNEYIHYLSDPDYYSTNLYGGDFEFAFVGGDSEELIFRGVKTDNTVRFVALDTDIVTAMQQVLEIKNVDMYFVQYTLEDGTELEGDSTGYNIISFLEDPEDEYSTVSIAYAYSVDGMTFYEPVELQGQTVQDFTWDATEMCFTSKEEGTSVKIFGQLHENYMEYEDYLGDYTLRYTTMSSGQGTRTFTLRENVNGSSYYLNLGNINSDYDDYDILVNYTPSGYLIVYAQSLGSYVYDSSYTTWLCPWDSDGGTFTWSTSVGVKFVNNGNDPNNLSFTFEDNGMGYAVNAFVLAYFDSSGSYVAYFDYIRPISMVKQ